jgi:hypothetical protein
MLREPVRLRGVTCSIQGPRPATRALSLTLSGPGPHHPGPRAGTYPFPMIRVVIVVVLVGAGLLAVGCGRDLPRDTPEATLQSARQVVAEGRADLLGDFLYADSPQMRQLMDDMGIVLGHVQDLATAVQARFPAEVAQLREEAKAGRASGVLAQLTRQVRGGRPPQRQQGEQMRAAFDDTLKRLFADPYAFLADAEGRLTTQEVDDDTVALLWDGKPLLAPLGLTMRRDTDERWYFVLPTNGPGISSFMPRTAEQFEIFGSVLATLDNVVVDLTGEVKSGRITSLDRLSQVAGEKTFIPAVMTLYAYGRATELQKKEAKSAPPAGG